MKTKLSNKNKEFKRKYSNKSYYGWKVSKGRIEYQFIPYEDYKHLQSITAPDRTVKPSQAL